MRVFEDFLCERANCEQEMCVDAVVDANMFVFDRDVYVFGLLFVLNFTRNERGEKVLFGLGFCPFFESNFDPNTWPFLTTFRICALQRKVVVVVVVVVACTFNERNDERDDDSDDDDACERKF